VVAEAVTFSDSQIVQFGLTDLLIANNANEDTLSRSELSDVYDDIDVIPETFESLNGNNGFDFRVEDFEVYQLI